MKTLFFFLIIFFLNINLLFSQEEVPQQVIFLGIFGVELNETTSFTTTAQGTVWGRQSVQELLIANDPDAYESTYIQEGESSSAGTDTWGGWDIVTLSNLPQIIGWGLYKITTDENPSVYFYYNTIDCKWAHGCGLGYNPDARFSYNAELNLFKYKIKDDGQLLPTHNISNGQIINSWDILNQGSAQQTTGFEDYWENALNITKTGSGNPRIVWGPYPESVDLAGYNIYRKVSTGNFYLIDFVYETELDYTDTDYSVTPTGVQLQYYVKAVYPTEELSSPTNTVTTQGIITLKNNPAVSKDNLNEFYLYPNYPNPFNPSTKITYALPKDAKVHIKIYDMLGTEVAELVNETKPAGYYETTFATSDLSSGVYIYRITALNGDRILFSQSKQMILLK